MTSGVVIMLLPAALVTAALHSDAVALGVVAVIWVIGIFAGYLFVARPAWAMPDWIRNGPQRTNRPPR
jgi:hypothetical protein